ncbi:MAG: hypothetical protein AAGF28_01955 [Pseudomonadota bacterium]
MFTRISGLIILGNTLLPVILVFGLVILFGTFGSDLREDWRKTSDGVAQIAGAGQKIQRDLDKMSTNAGKHLKKAGKAAKAITRTVEKPVKTIEKAISKIQKLPLKIGDVLTAPFRAVISAFNGLISPVKELGAAATEIAKGLNTIGPQIEVIKKAADTVQTSASDTQKTVMKLFTALFWCFVGLALWFAFSYIFWVRGRLNRGYRMMVYGATPVG